MEELEAEQDRREKLFIDMTDRAYKAEANLARLVEAVERHRRIIHEYDRQYPGAVGLSGKDDDEELYAVLDSIKETK